MEWLDQDAEDFSSPSGSLAGDESAPSEIDELLGYREQNENATPSFDSPELLASYVGSPMRDHHSQGLAFFDAADCPQTDDEFIDDSGPEDGEESDTPPDAQSSAIAEIFRCFICLGKVVEAQLCPCCSKICCLRCIKRWLMDQRPQCPHCRASLRVSQLVNCRFIADLSTEIEKLQRSGLTEVQEKACSLHNSPMSYYCNTCTDAVCSDCAVFGEEHRGHSFERLSTVYERHVETIRSEAVGLRRRLKDLCALVSEKDKNIERVHKAKDEAGMELQLAFEGMQARLEQQLKSKLLTLLAQKGSMTQEIEGLDSMLHDLNLQLNTVPKGDLVARSGSICGMLHEVQQRPTSDVNRTPVPADFISEVVPPYDQGEFVLHDFEHVLRRTSIAGPPVPSPRGVTSVRTVEPAHGSNAAVNPSEDPSDGAGVVYSQPIHAAGIVWRLKVYPNGNGVAAGSYLSVFLEMVQGGSEPAKYEYKIEMLHRTRPSQSVIREFASVFEVGECWGYNRFFRLEVLKDEGYLLPEEDVITLRFHVRAPTYAQQCQDLRRALVVVDNEKADALKQVDVLRRAIADTLWWKRRRKMPANRDAPAGRDGPESGPDKGPRAAVGEDMNAGGARRDVSRGKRRSDDVRKDRSREDDVSSDGKGNDRFSNVNKHAEIQEGRDPGGQIDFVAGGQKRGIRPKASGGKKKAGAPSKRPRERRDDVSAEEPSASGGPEAAQPVPVVGVPERDEVRATTGADSPAESDEEFVEASEGSPEARDGLQALFCVEEVTPGAEGEPKSASETLQGDGLKVGGGLGGVGEVSGKGEGLDKGIKESGRAEPEESDEEFVAASERSSDGNWSQDLVLESVGLVELPRSTSGTRATRGLRSLLKELSTRSGRFETLRERDVRVVEEVGVSGETETMDTGNNRRVGETSATNLDTAEGSEAVKSLNSGTETKDCEKAEESIGAGSEAGIGVGEGLVGVTLSDPADVSQGDGSNDVRSEKVEGVDSVSEGRLVNEVSVGEERASAKASLPRLWQDLRLKAVDTGADREMSLSEKKGSVGETKVASLGCSSIQSSRTKDEVAVGESIAPELATSAAASSPGEIRQLFRNTARGTPIVSDDARDTDKENLRSGDLAQARALARSSCFMERVAKVSLVDGNDGALGQSLLGAGGRKGGLGIGPLRAELKSRLRSEGRVFGRGRDRKSGMDDSRVGIAAEEPRAESLVTVRRKDGSSSGDDQAWRNNPFIRPAPDSKGMESKERPEAEPAASTESERKRNWEVLLDRAIMSTEALEAPRGSEMGSKGDEQAVRLDLGGDGDQHTVDPSSAGSVAEEESKAPLTKQSADA